LDVVNEIEGSRPNFTCAHLKFARVKLNSIARTVIIFVVKPTDFTDCKSNGAVVIGIKLAADVPQFNNIV
jgi:hypothetical protein